MNLLRSKKPIWIVTALAVTTLIVVYGGFNPAETPFPRCPFLVITGWQCPGCGSQRAIHALLHGNIRMAWNYNAALICCIPVIITMAVASANRRRFSRLYSFLNSSKACICWLIILIAWAFLRNLTN